MLFFFHVSSVRGDWMGRWQWWLLITLFHPILCCVGIGVKVEARLSARYRCDRSSIGDNVHLFSTNEFYMQHYAAAVLQKDSKYVK